MALNQTLTVIILAGNEQDIIKQALDSATWADQIVIVAANSTDNTVKMARRYTKDIVTHHDEYGKHFDLWRNQGLAASTSDWVFYLDADEKISPALKKEILKTINSHSPHTHYALPRLNHYLGQQVKSGGAYPDHVKRLYLRKKLKKWLGRVHERPVVSGSMGFLKNDLPHYTHRDLSSMLQKTIIWTQTEAEALYRSGHPPVVWWRILRMMATKFWERIIRQSSWKDGTVGIVNSIFEIFNTFVIYARLWEMQQKNESRHLRPLS
jgi:(heptosyl)LPS beta-1,4-glucosyltransferase